MDPGEHWYSRGGVLGRGLQRLTLWVPHWPLPPRFHTHCPLLAQGSLGSPEPTPFTHLHSRLDWGAMTPPSTPSCSPQPLM